MAKGMGRRPKVDLDIEDVTFLILEWLGEQGVDAMIRVDAERMRDGQPAWTFAASGGPLGAGIRAEGASVAECVGMALLRLRKAELAVPF